MNYPVDTPAQLRAVLKALRNSRGLSQTALGAQLGVNQKRIARIESAPGVTSFDQVARLVAALGGRIVIEELQPVPQQTRAPSADASTRKRSASSKTTESW